MNRNTYLYTDITDIILYRILYARVMTRSMTSWKLVENEIIYLKAVGTPTANISIL